MSTPVPQKTLTNMVNGLLNESADKNALFIAPVVPTGIATFTVSNYAVRSGFQTPTTARAIGGDSTAVQSDGDQVTISLKPNGLHEMIDDHELDMAGSQGLTILRQSKTQNLVSQASNSRFKDTIELINDTLGAGVVTDWSTAGSGDPVAEIDAAIEAMNDATGRMPNRMLISLKAWRIFRNHPKVIERFPGMMKVAPQVTDAEGFFINDIKIVVCSTVFDTKMNATSSKSNAIGSDLYLFYAQEGANTYDNSFAKTFRVKSTISASVRTSRKDHGEKLMVDWTELVFVNNPAVGLRWDIQE